MVETWRSPKIRVSDDTLAGLTLLDASVRYSGWETNLEPGRTGEAYGMLAFDISYLLKQSELGA